MPLDNMNLIEFVSAKAKVILDLVKSSITAYQ